MRGNGKALETRLNSRKQDVLDLEVNVGEAGKKCRLISEQAAEAYRKEPE